MKTKFIIIRDIEISRCVLIRKFYLRSMDKGYFTIETASKGMIIF